MRSEAGTIEIAVVANLFGGAKVLKSAPRTSLEAHDLLLAGLPGAAIGHLIERLQILPKNKSLENAVGMSLRTFQRRRESASKPLTADQSGRAWKFAEILARATDIFGSQEEAERWLQEPAMGLDHRKPIDLLATPAGTEMVETFLTRLDYGVYM